MAESGSSSSSRHDGQPLQGSCPSQDGAAPDMGDLARGGEALLQHLADVSAANAALQRQLEAQSKEILVLEESGRVLQQRLRHFDQRAAEVSSGELSAAEARLGAEAAEREARLRAQAAEAEGRLRAELQEAAGRAQREREELLERLQRCDAERGAREAERDAAQAQRDTAQARARELEAQLRAAEEAPEPGDAGARLAAMGLEAALLRTRLAQEVGAREAASREAARAGARARDLESRLEASVGEGRRLRQASAEAAEQAGFWREACEDSRARLREQRAEAAERLSQERGRLQAITRLEGVLPRGVLIKALA